MIYKKCILITGGVRSGKSRYALDLVHKITEKKIFIATAQAFDVGMAMRIKKHQQERGIDFVTMEEPLYLAQALKDASPQAPLVIIDCLTVWVNNLFYHLQHDQSKIQEQFDLFLAVLAESSLHIIIVTNEVGLGIMPDNQLGRRFIDELGSLNQRVASLSDEVIMMVAGLPQIIKGVNSYESMDYTSRKYSSS